MAVWGYHSLSSWAFVSQGKTEEQAKKDIAEAIELHLPAPAREGTHIGLREGGKEYRLLSCELYKKKMRHRILDRAVDQGRLFFEKKFSIEP
jgi:hypothetical protein